MMASAIKSGIACLREGNRPRLYMFFDYCKSCRKCVKKSKKQEGKKRREKKSKSFGVQFEDSKTNEAVFRVHH